MHIAQEHMLKLHRPDLLSLRAMFFYLVVIFHFFLLCCCYCCCCLTLSNVVIFNFYSSKFLVAMLFLGSCHGWKRKRFGVTYTTCKLQVWFGLNFTTFDACHPFKWQRNETNRKKPTKCISLSATLCCGRIERHNQNHIVNTL